MSYYTKTSLDKQKCKDGEYFDAYYFGISPSYLTNINKSDSISVKKQWKPHKDWSENLLNDLNSKDAKLHILQDNIKFKQFNHNELIAYRAPKKSSRINVKFKNTGKFSNTECARFSSRNRLIAKIKANPEFRYYFTGTFNQKLQNRRDAEKLQAHLSKFLQRRGIKYILVPEQHEDGAWHFHGLFDASVEPYLARFDIEHRKLAMYIINAIKKENRDIFDFPEYQKNFGFVSIERIKSLDRVAVYITKYISKGFDNPESRVFYHRYFCSKGLKEPKVIHFSEFNYSDYEPVHLSEYCPKIVFKRRAGGVGTVSPRVEAPPDSVGSQLALDAPPNFTL